MRTLVVTHYYPPEVGAPQARLSELAKAWSRLGDDVTVLTGLPNHPTGIIHEAYRGKLRMREDIDGVGVVRTWVYATPNEGFLRKTIGHVSFMLSSVLFGLRGLGPPDVVIVSSPTFFSIFSAWVIARIKRAALVVEVRDLWPGIFVELGVLKNRTVIRVLETLELASYRAADAVVTVTHGFREDIVSRGIDAAKVHVIPNGVEVDRFANPEGDTDAIREQLGARPDETLVLYSGAHGISHALLRIADAADRLRDAPVHIAFVGEGATKAELAARVRELGLENVSMHPSVPSEQMPALVAAADICLVPLRDVPLFSTFIPSKMFEYMAARRPIVASVRGEAASILERAGAVVVEPEDADAIADAIRKLAADPALRESIGSDEQRFVAGHYDRRTLARAYHDILDDVLRERASSRGRAS
jgi:glycosyltransferase involved in cell wall biosynthesis